MTEVQRRGVRLSRDCGTHGSSPRDPASELAGYFQRSLRDHCLPPTRVSTEPTGFKILSRVQKSDPQGPQAVPRERPTTQFCSRNFLSPVYVSGSERWL